MANLRFLFAFIAFVLLAVSSSANLIRFNSSANQAFPNGSLTTCATASAVGNESLAFPLDVHIYNQYLLIADTSNSRVLLVDRATNEIQAIFGQNNATSNNQSTSATGLRFPIGIYVDDRTGTLYICDVNNNRVTSYILAGLSIGTPQAAQTVLGQPDLTSMLAGTSQTNLSAPRDVFVDTPNNRLWVLDYGNKRALWYTIPLLAANGQAASGVIGTANTSDFNSVGTFFATPNGILVDRQNRLYIADTSNNRVIRYDVATNNTPSIAFGQPDLTSVANNTGATGLDYPRAIAFDIANDILFVSDLRNNRVVGYPNASNINQSDAAAYVVVGQSDYTSNAAGCSETQLNSPVGIFYADALGVLAVADERNFRAVEYVNNNTLANMTVLSVSNRTMPSVSNNTVPSVSNRTVSNTHTTATVSASPSASGSNSPLCVRCQSSKCGGDVQFDKICTNTLRGTPMRVNDQQCCQGATRTTNNQFTFSSSSCGSGKRKLRELCSDLKGTVTCSGAQGRRQTNVCSF